MTGRRSGCNATSGSRPASRAPSPGPPPLPPRRPGAPGRPAPAATAGRRGSAAGCARSATRRGSAGRAAPSTRPASRGRRSARATGRGSRGRSRGRRTTDSERRGQPLVLGVGEDRRAGGRHLRPGGVQQSHLIGGREARVPGQELQQVGGVGVAWIQPTRGSSPRRSRSSRRYASASSSSCR